MSRSETLELEIVKVEEEMQETEEKEMEITVETKSSIVEVNIVVDFEREGRRIVVSSFLSNLLKTYRGSGMTLKINFLRE